MPHNLHRFLIGKHGSTIETLRSTTGCHIIVPAASLHSDTVMLHGTPESILDAKAQIDSLMQRMLLKPTTQ